MSNINELFSEIADQKVWSAYQGDEVPVGEPMTLTQAQSVAAEQGLPGVGIVLTGGVHTYLSGGFKLTLVAFDFIGADPDKFELPLHSYCERSPSGDIRAFGWAPAYWAEKYADSPRLTPPEYVHCERAAFWFGTSPKFVAVTGGGGGGIRPMNSESGCGQLDCNIKEGWRNHLDRFKGFNRAENRIDERTEKWLKYERDRRREWESKCSSEWKQGEAERRAKWEAEQDELEACRARMEARS